MKLCSACHEEKTQDAFSKKQWQLKKFRRCKMCVDENRALQMEPPAPAAVGNSSSKNHQQPVGAHGNIPDGASCWICLDDGLDDLLRQPIRRDCACRGSDSGFAHISCITRYASTKSKEVHGRDIDKFFEAWSKCPNCEQPYANDLAIELGSACIQFVEETFPRTVLLHIKAHHVKIQAFNRMVNLERMNGTQRDDAIDVAHKTIGLVGAIKRQYSSMPREIIGIEADANMHLCNIIGMRMGGTTVDEKKIALEHAEKSRRLFKSINEDTRVMLVDNMISNLESNFTGGVSKEEIEKFDVIYKQTVKRHGENNLKAVTSAMVHATDLKAMHHGIEAERLAAKYTDICHRVCGPGHDMTKEVATILNAFRTRLVKLKNQEDCYAKALHYEGNDGTLVCRGPVRDEWDTEGEVFTLAPHEYEIKSGNPIVCVGLEETEYRHLNGKIGDVRGTDVSEEFYEIHFEDEELEPCWLLYENVRILFDLPKM